MSAALRMQVNANVISIITILTGFPVAWQLAPRGPLTLQPPRPFYKQGLDAQWAYCV